MKVISVLPRSRIAFDWASAPLFGVTVGFSAQLQEADTEAAALAGNTRPAGEKTKKLDFTVTARDIENAKQLINSQRITYREPKRSFLKI